MDPGGALIIGLIARAALLPRVDLDQEHLRYDDSLDAFGVHGVGGIVGALLTGIFAFPSMGGVWSPAEGATIASQLWVQTKGVLFTLAYTGIATVIILKIVDVLVGLRVSAEQEEEGLDLALHDERGYNL